MKMRALIATAVLALPVSATAATVYELEATAADISTNGFSLTFEDLDGDMLFSVDELLTFSGIQFNFFGDPFFQSLTGAPDIAGISDGGLDRWFFGDEIGGGGVGNTAPPGFTYNLTELAAVPLPAAGFMLLAGLGGIVALRRRPRS